jgi:hypothetical protein
MHQDPTNMSNNNNHIRNRKYQQKHINQRCNEELDAYTNSLNCDLKKAQVAFYLRILPIFDAY